MRHLFLTWTEVDALIDHLLPQMRGGFDAMLMVTRGGLVPGGILAEALDIKHVLTAAMRFPASEEKMLAWPTFLQFPEDELLRDRRVLIVDDVWGSARTINTVRGRTEAAGARPEVLHWQLDCGLRISEAIRLRPDRVNFDAGTIEVKGKGGKKRVIKVSDRMLLDRLPRSGTFPLLNGNATSWTRQIEKLVAAACTELDIQCLGTHGFRASAAQRTLDDLLESGVDERSARKQVSRLLGHNRTSVTRSYAP